MRPALITFSVLACVAGLGTEVLGLSFAAGLIAYCLGVFGLIAAVVTEPEI